MDYKALIQYLKESCFIDDPTMVDDSQFLALTESELENILKVSLSKVNTILPHLSEEDKLYGIVINAKQDVYSRLSLKYAIQFDISGEVGSLNKSNRFKHFSSLLNSAREEWNEYVNVQQAQRDVSNTTNYSDLANGEMFIERNYFSSRSVQYANKPQVEAKVENVSKSILELSWKIKRINLFKNYKVYLSTSPIYDKFENTLTGTLITTITDIHRTFYRVKDLKPNTTYYVVLVLEELNGLSGIHELVVTTEGDENA